MPYADCGAAGCICVFNINSGVTQSTMHDLSAAVSRKSKLTLRGNVDDRLRVSVGQGGLTVADTVER